MVKKPSNGPSMFGGSSLVDPLRSLVDPLKKKYAPAEPLHDDAFDLLYREFEHLPEFMDKLMPVLRDTIKSTQESVKNNTIATTNLLDSLQDVHAGRRTQALAHDMSEALISWYQKDAVDTRYVRKAEQFLSRYHGIVQQTATDIETRNRALASLNLAKGRLEYRRHKQERRQSTGGDEAARREEKIVRNQDDVEFLTGEFNVLNQQALAGMRKCRDIHPRATYILLYALADWHHEALGIRPIKPFAEVLGGVHPQLKELDDWMDVKLDGVTIRQILERDEIAGAKEEEERAKETNLLDFRPYHMRKQPIPKEGVQRAADIEEQLLTEDRKYVGHLREEIHERLKAQEPEVGEAVQRAYEREVEERVQKAKELEEKMGRLKIDETEPPSKAPTFTSQSRPAAVELISSLLKGPTGGSGSSTVPSLKGGGPGSKESGRMAPESIREFSSTVGAKKASRAYQKQGPTATTPHFTSENEVQQPAHEIEPRESDQKHYDAYSSEGGGMAATSGRAEEGFSQGSNGDRDRHQEEAEAKPSTKFHAAPAISPEMIPEISGKTLEHESIHNTAHKEQQDIEPAHRFAHDEPPMHAEQGEVPLELSEPPPGALHILEAPEEETTKQETSDSGIGEAAFHDQEDIHDISEKNQQDVEHHRFAEAISPTDHGQDAPEKTAAKLPEGKSDPDESNPTGSERYVLAPEKLDQKFHVRSEPLITEQKSTEESRSDIPIEGVMKAHGHA